MNTTDLTKDAVREYYKEHDITELVRYPDDFELPAFSSKKVLRVTVKNLLENVKDLTKLVLDEQNIADALRKDNNDLRKEIGAKDREIALLKVLFREFYQTIYEKAEQNKNLWVGLKQSLDNISADALNIEHINSLVAASKEQRLTEHQIQETLRKEGVLVKTKLCKRENTDEQ